MGEKGRDRENDGERKRLGRESTQTGLGLKSIALHDDGKRGSQCGSDRGREMRRNFLNENKRFFILT